MIKHDTFSNQVFSRVTHFLPIVKQQTGKTCKISYNWIFITNVFLKMDEKTCLKGPKIGPAWPGWKYYFLRFQMFVFS